VRRLRTSVQGTPWLSCCWASLQCSSHRTCRNLHSLPGATTGHVGSCHRWNSSQRTWAILGVILLLLFVCGIRVWSQGPHFKLLHQLSFVKVIFQDRVSWTICPGWLQTMILLISAS
jgi:hypothetical protein